MQGMAVRLQVPGTVALRQLPCFRLGLRWVVVCFPETHGFIQLTVRTDIGRRQQWVFALPLLHTTPGIEILCVHC